MKLKIRQQDDPCLKERCRPISKVGIPERLIVSSLLDTLQDHKGWGLAAPQVGVNEQIFVITIDGDILAVINPVITKKIGTSVMEEGCLSIPRKQIKVERPEEIEVEFLDLHGQTVVMKLSGVWARVFQHEYDHLQGILITDYENTLSKAS